MKKNVFIQWVLCLVSMMLISCRLDPSVFQENLKKVRQEQQQKIKAIQETRQLVASIDDKTRIVYVDMVDDKTQLFTMTSAGSDKRQLTHTDFYKSRPTWSLDHKQIAYFNYQSELPVGDDVAISIINADGSNDRQVVLNKKIDTKKSRICWHPRGDTIYVREKDFVAMLFGYRSTDGTQCDTIRLAKQTFMVEAHTLSPNFQKISGAGPTKKGLWHIGTSNLDGSNETDLMKVFKKVNFDIGTVVWSYDSNFIAFEVDKIIMVMSSSYNLKFKAYPITPKDFNTEMSQPAFSPSGQQMLAVSEKTEEGHRGSGDSVVKSNIVVMNIDGSKQTQITTSGTCFDPHW